MKTNEQLLKIGLDAINKQVKDTALQEVVFFGKKLIIMKDVWSPEHSSTKFMAQNLGVVKGKTIIEMGSGSGALSIIACVNGANQLYSFDINEKAVECTLVNAKKNGFQDKIKVFQSNLFESAPRIKVDLIVFNPPFTNVSEEKNSLLGLAVFDKNHSTIDSFLSQAKNFLKSEGRIRLAFSLSAGNINLFKEICKKNNFSTRIVAERKVDGKHHRIYELKVAKAAIIDANLEKLAIFGGPKTIKFPEPHFTWSYGAEEKEAVIEYLNKKKPISIYGREGIYEEFEETFRKYHHTKYALTTCNGTSALHSAFFGLNITEGDEVIAPTYTFLATVMPLVQLRATPVLCDAELETGNIDPKDIKKKITKKTKAIVVTHVWGHPVELSEIYKIAKENNLALIEDCSHAHGAKYKDRKVGTFGDVACFSLQANKIISGGEAGIMITNNQEVYERATLLGHYRNRSEETVKLKFYKQFVKTGYGLKYRAHPLSIVIANNQFKHLDEWIKKRNKKLNYLSKKLSAIKGIEPPITKPYVSRGAYYGYKPKFKQEEFKGLTKEKYIKILQAEGVEIHKPGSMPLHTLPFFQTRKDGLWGKTTTNKNKKVYKQGDMPKSEEYYNQTLSLPTFTFEPKELIDQYVVAFEKIAKHY